MFCYCNVFISLMHCIGCHLLKGVDAVALVCMHMEVAFYIAGLHKHRQFLFFSSLYLAHILPQLGRYPRQANCPINILLPFSSNPLIRLFIKDTIFAYLKPHLLCPVADGNIMCL